MSTVLAPPSQSKSSVELAALRAINYDWTMHLQNVWTDPHYDSPEIHTQLRQEFQNRLDEFNKDRSVHSPLGWLVIGAAGTGKTHWLSICRQQAVARQISFVLVDMTDVRSFWDTVLQGYLDSLQQEYTAGKFQQQVLIERFLQTVGLREPVETALKKLREYPRDRLAHNIDAVLAIIQTRYPQSIRHHDVIRALLAMVSHEAGVAAAGFSWLSANPVDEDCRKLLGFIKAQEEPRQIVRALSWMMSLCSPTVLAFDQLDPIVAQLDPAAQADGKEMGVEGLRALSIIQEIANGLGIMRDATYRTLTLVCCLDTTISALRRYTNKSWQDRFHESISLNPIKSADAAASLLYPRVLAGCQSVGFSPPSQVWPLSQQALNEVDGQTPRELLKICESHRQRCDHAGAVSQLSTLKETDAPSIPPPAVDLTLNKEFERYRQAADVSKLLEQSTEDERIAPLILAGCRCLLREINLPQTVDAVVDDFPGGKTTKPLHGRIRIIDHEANDREVHFCFRALERKNAIAFQARLKGVMNGSGIDRRLPFRHSVILRTQPIPGGEITQKLVTQYNESGGRWHEPSDDEVRTLFALQELTKLNPPGMENWLKQRRPASRMKLFKFICKQLFEPCESVKETSLPPQIEPKKPSSQPRATTAERTVIADGNAAKPLQAISQHTPAQIPLGRRQIGSTCEIVQLPLQLLEKHTVVLAGAGSGKTVLLKRLIEEAAIAGTPSIVIDGANDLAALGERWPSAPEGWFTGDAPKAEMYFARTEVAIWTPGRDSGNPLSLEPLPDLAAVANDEEELEAAVAMAREALVPIVATGKSQGSKNKVGILSAALKYFARHGGGSLANFISILADLEPDAGIGVKNESKLAREMADCLRSETETNPLLRSNGTPLDPAALFGDDQLSNAKTRISVINLVGLASLETQRQFLNQLAMTLFSWIKKNPSPPGRALRGLLVIDEAKDFIPSQASTACKESLMRLTAQARKYHLGVIFATQNPREIDNRIIGNCSTHYYGKASSPAAIEVIKDQIRQRGGTGDDIPTLPRGRFYVYNADIRMTAPTKVQVPLCLSHHRANPFTEDEIIARAAAFRRAQK